LAAVAAAATMFVASQAAASERGAALFEPCRACHALDPSASDTPGPNLHGIVGRKVADDPKFDYSPVLRDANKSGAVWTRERLDTFLADGEAMFPGMWMIAKPMTDSANRKALADFLTDPKSR
jgi:cytochrome c